jgi:hypothetical protein
VRARLVLIALVLAAVAEPAALVPGATAANECAGLQVCLPVIGPWVAILPEPADPPPAASYQLACPIKGYLVAGLDADVTNSGIDVAFLGRLGSPVGPGLTTSAAVVFVGTNTRTAKPQAFRPYIGCVPARGGGGRSQTGLHRLPVLRAGQPLDRHSVNFQLQAGTSRSFPVACPTGERAVGASHAFAFVSEQPPGEAQLAALHAQTRVVYGHAQVEVQTGKAVSGYNVELQVLLLCTLRTLR